ncbi:type II toxin-antitoxin system HicB family antitoxin [Chryseobacterium sp.]|uniref:type II toxin-antitoxin system HicB family antitoxin n=1 Tax=Chryseobacterium sp. TaxID=1871047 RepID=UPI0028A11F7A|nr:type II toxin-antitoxin system HicB family antitoxin [Chryseobacterium sp.]
MKTIKIAIEKTPDMYSAYAENVEGIYGGGNTPQEAKESILKSIKLLIENNTKENIPSILKGEYNIKYEFDTESLINYLKGIITYPGIERITGVNEKQIAHYSSGLKKPRKEQREKIQNGIHNFAKELLAIEL